MARPPSSNFPLSRWALHDTFAKHGEFIRFQAPWHRRGLFRSALVDATARRDVRFRRRARDEHVSLRAEGRSLSSRKMAAALPPRALDRNGAADWTREAARDRFRLRFPPGKRPAFCRRAAGENADRQGCAFL